MRLRTESCILLRRRSSTSSDHSAVSARGDIMSVVGLNRANPRPSREKARQAMSGNPCRCGACDHNLNGVMRAAERNT